MRNRRITLATAVFYGAYLDIIDVEGDDWLEVRHRSGDVGWILSRDEEDTYAYRSGEYYPNMKSSGEFLDASGSLRYKDAQAPAY